MCHLCVEREIDMIGTAKINRKGLPKAGIFPKKGKNKKGGSKGSGEGTGCPSTSPDGQRVCFQFNSGGCHNKKGCKFAHICGTCFAKGHSMAQCTAA